MTERMEIFELTPGCQNLEKEAIGRIAPSKLEWLRSIKPGDTVASRWRTSGRVYIEEIIKEIVIYDPCVGSRISVQFEDGSIVDSTWIEPIIATRKY